jgi:hypothetical protein
MERRGREFIGLARGRNGQGGYCVLKRGSNSLQGNVSGEKLGWRRKITDARGPHVGEGERGAACTVSGSR